MAKELKEEWQELIKLRDHTSLQIRAVESEIQNLLDCMFNLGLKIQLITIQLKEKGLEL